MALHADYTTTIYNSDENRVAVLNGSLNEIIVSTIHNYGPVNSESVERLVGGATSPLNPAIKDNVEFDAVVIVGVDKGRVPQVTSSESRIYQNYEWHNRMYVAITRAKYAVVILGNKSRTASSLLQNAITHNRINLVEV